MEAFAARETLEGFHSCATNKIGTASKCVTFRFAFTIIHYSYSIKSNLLLQNRHTRLATFPDYLVIQLKKFCMGDDWTPKKLDVSVDMPLDLDLSGLRA